MLLLLPLPLSAYCLRQAPALSSAQLRKNRDKLVALLEEGQLALLEAGDGRRDSLEQRDSLPGDEELLPVAVEEAPAVTGRISIYCTATRWAAFGGSGWPPVAAVLGGLWRHRKALRVRACALLGCAVPHGISRHAHCLLCCWCLLLPAATT